MKHNPVDSLSRWTVWQADPLYTSLAILQCQSSRVQLFKAHRTQAWRMTSLAAWASNLNASSMGRVLIEPLAKEFESCACAYGGLPHRGRKKRRLVERQLFDVRIRLAPELATSRTLFAKSKIFNATPGDLFIYRLLIEFHLFYSKVMQIVLGLLLDIKHQIIDTCVMGIEKSESTCSSYMVMQLFDCYSKLDRCHSRSWRSLKDTQLTPRRSIMLRAVWYESEVAAPPLVTQFRSIV